jgi:hypothetical protein
MLIIYIILGRLTFKMFIGLIQHIQTNISFYNNLILLTIKIYFRQVYT